MSTHSTTSKPNRALNIGLWITQSLLAAMFLFAGSPKAFGPIADLVKQGATWAADMPWLIRFIGISEIAGALGMILPAATRIKPILTPIAAIGLGIIMVLAAAFHISRGEASHIGINIVLGAMAALVAWGRFGKAKIAERGADSGYVALQSSTS